MVAGAAALFGTLSYITRNAAELGMGALPYVAWRGLVGTVAVLAFSQLAAVRATRRGGAAPAWLPSRRGRRRLRSLPRPDAGGTSHGRSAAG